MNNSDNAYSLPTSIFAYVQFTLALRGKFLCTMRPIVNSSKTTHWPGSHVLLSNLLLFIFVVLYTEYYAYLTTFMLH